MTVDGKNLETYAIVKLSNLNPKSDEIFKPLVAAGYEIIKREDPKGNTIDHVIVKDPTKDKITDIIDKLYTDICECEATNTCFFIDGQEFYTDTGYAMDGIEMFVKLLKQRLSKKEKPLE